MIFAVTACMLFTYTNAKINISSSNITDEKLTVSLDTFVNYNGFRQKLDLRYPPKYNHPSERALNLKVIDMMKQAIYDTQDKMMELNPVLDKYRDDPSTKMAFIFNRLKQLIIDMRRIYTLARKWRRWRRVYEQIIWYSHCFRKYIDVMYIVDYLIDSHVEYARIFEKMRGR